VHGEGVAHAPIRRVRAAAPSSTPTGVAVFARDIAQPVRRTAERDNQIVHWSEFDHGGHFAAMEQPELLVGEIRAFFRLVGSPRRVQ
jgi:pimeloyl-ACP methyl ester carboxylesterase